MSTCQRHGTVSRLSHSKLHTKLWVEAIVCKNIGLQTSEESLNRQRQDHVTPKGSQSTEDSNESDSNLEKEVIDVSSDESQYLDVSGTIVSEEHEGSEAPVALESNLENRIGRNRIVSTCDLRCPTESIILKVTLKQDQFESKEYLRD
jgi:hypothetical protein